VKVLQILPELNAGGVERTTLEMAEALFKAGHEPYVCSAGGRLEPEFEPFQTFFHNFDVGSKNPFKLRKNTKRLIEIIKSENIDIVHARSRAPAWPAHAAAKATGRPFLTTYHGIYNARNKAKKRYNAIMARGDLIIANSIFTREHIIQEHGTDPDIIRIIPRGVDMAIFDPAIINQKDVAAQRQAWGLSGPQKILLLPARLTRWKGQLVAIKALSKLPEDWNLVMIGDAQGRTDYVEELKSEAKKLGVSDRIQLPGHSANVPTAMLAADIIIAPSIEPEAFGRTVAEAQAMCRPVIAAAHGGPMETVLDGDTGLLVPPSDADALALAVQKIEVDMGFHRPKARAHIQTHFSKSQLQAKTLAVYQELMM